MLIVEDEPLIAKALEAGLTADGYGVDVADRGDVGLWQATENDYDAIILDVMLPGMNGFKVCSELRAAGVTTPIMMLTAKDGEYDQAEGLDTGADDYVTKPFSPRELVARVKAILRRTGAVASTADRPEPIDLGWELVVDPGRREATIAGEPVALATREFDLLQYLAEHRGLALSRRQLLDGVWGEDWIGDDRTVDVHVRQLRKKLGDALRLETVWGVGYRLD